MFSFLTIFNILIVLTAVIIGSLLIIKGTKNKQAMAFSMLNFATALWIPANFFGNYATNYELAKILTLADFAMGVVLADFFWLFARATRQTINSSKFQKSDISIMPLILLSLVVVGLIITGQVVGTDPDTLSAFNKGFYWTYPLIIFILSGLALKDLAIARLKSKGLQKTQTNLMLAGLIIAVLFIVVPNFLLENIFAKGPLLVLSYDISYLGILVFLLFSSYAIIKHRLFDIRFVIVRSLAYGLSITILGTLYAVLTFVIINKLIFPSNKIGVNQEVVYTVQAVYTVLAVVMAFLFQPLLGFFNRLTQKIFYKNAYKTQDVINKISSVIAGTISSKKIQKDALSILEEAVPTIFTAFLLFDENTTLTKGAMSGERHIDKSDIEILQKALNNNPKKMIIYDDLENNAHLQDSLSTLSISIVAPLATSRELVGYLVLGDKKSGDAYKNQDVQLLNIVSKQLAVALQNTSRFEKIQDFNVTLQNKVKNATKQLRSTNRQLVTMDEIKDDFINIASHQLRTPLTSIKGYIAMLLDDDFGNLNKNQRQALQEAFTSSQRMVFLISDFLNLSRIKAGRFEIDAQPLNLSEIVNEEILQLRETANSRQLSLEYNPPEKFPEVVLDENKIRQVIMNMIDNAIYYTPKGGTVNVELYATDKDVVFKVKDNGIGVPKSDQHKLFTKFYRAENAQRARPDGTGIGMFLAKKIIVAQGGAILFESQENKGSTFGFSFPLAEIRRPKDHKDT